MCIRYSWSIDSDVQDMEHLIIFNLSDYCYFLFLVADKKFPVSLSWDYPLSLRFHQDSDPKKLKWKRVADLCS